MFKLKEFLVTIVLLSVVLIGFQNCSPDATSSSNHKILSVEEGVATVEVSAEEGADELMLKIPDQLISDDIQNGQKEALKWFFVDEDGNETDLENESYEFDLTGLDKSFFSHGVFKVIFEHHNVVEVIIFIIEFNLVPGAPAIGLQIVGVPPKPVGLSIVEPVGLVAPPVGQPVGLQRPPMPIGLTIGVPVIGKQVIGKRIIGLPGKSVIGKRVMGLPASDK